LGGVAILTSLLFQQWLLQAVPSGRYGVPAGELAEWHVGKRPATREEVPEELQPLVSEIITSRHVEQIKSKPLSRQRQADLVPPPLKTHAGGC